LAITIAKGNTKKRKSAIDLFEDSKGIIIPIIMTKNNIKNVNRDLLTLITISLKILDIHHTDKATINAIAKTIKRLL
jgi:hypothetical protein